MTRRNFDNVDGNLFNPFDSPGTIRSPAHQLDSLRTLIRTHAEALPRITPMNAKVRARLEKSRVFRPIHPFSLEVQLAAFIRVVSRDSRAMALLLPVLVDFHSLPFPHVRATHGRHSHPSRRGLPRGGRSHPRHPHPPARRLRCGRGCNARRVQCRPPTLARGGPSGEPARV